MPFGWKNAPFFFQNYTQTRIANRHPVFTKVNIDDIIVHSETKQNHFEHIDQVLGTIQDENIILKLSKCTFFQPELEYLGHVLSKEGIRKDPKKVAAILKANTPKSKEDVRRFLGKINYYGKFVPNMARIAKPLSKLTSQSASVIFEWKAEQESAFRQLLEIIAQDVMLALPDPNKPFLITTDASHEGIGSVLSQKDE
jgi:predicted transcriptional regulator